MPSLGEQLQELFEADEDVREWMLIGRLPKDIAEIAADALDPKANEGKTAPFSLGSPDEYMRLGELIQRRFFPGSPGLERGGFLSFATDSGPAPDWVLIRQIASQIVRSVRERGHDVPLAEIERLADSL